MRPVISLTLLQGFYGPLHPVRSCVQHVMFQIQCFSSFLSFLPKKQKRLCYVLNTDSKISAILIGSIHHLKGEKISIHLSE